MKKRHSFFYALFRPLVILFVKFRFGYTFETAEKLPENYLVLSNHTTDYDMLFAAASFPRMMYFVGSEHIARLGALYTFLKFAFAPIMRPKGASAAHTVKEMLRVARGGGNVCLFAEGVRSWDGTPSPIAPSTAKMVRRMGCGLVTYRICGGYFASPMWAGAGVRRGPVHGAPVRVYTKAQIAAMSDQELYAAICADLGEDAYTRQLAAPADYRSKAPAQGLENLLYLCPQCGAPDSMTSGGDTVTCSRCALRLRYDRRGMLTGTRFATLKDLHAWQKAQTAEHARDGMAYTAHEGTLSAVSGHTGIPLAQGAVSMTAAALRCGELEFPMEEIHALAMHGQRAIVFTAGKTYYELIISPGSNALKFFIYYNCTRQNIIEKVR